MQQTKRTLAPLGLALAALAFCLVLQPTAIMAQERTYDISELTTQPSLESPQRAAAAIDRSYPRRLRSQQVTGTVHLSFIVDQDGAVDHESIHVLSADVERLGEAARQAVTRIRFNPGTLNGAAVRVRVTLPIVYHTR